jgi:hypothetical protein
MKTTYLLAPVLALAISACSTTPEIKTMPDGTKVFKKLTRICVNQTNKCTYGFVGYHESSETVKIISLPTQVKTNWSNAERLNDWWSGTKEQQQQLHTGLSQALRDYRQNQEPPVNSPHVGNSNSVVESLRQELELVDDMVLVTPAW